MKRILIFMVMVCMGNFLFAQSNANFTPRKNEVSLNLPIAIFASFPEISYERIVSEDMGVGLSTAFSLEEDFIDMKFMAIPYVRWYFGGSMESAQRYGAGFFLEANGAVFSTKRHEVTETGAGLGLALGWKFVTKGNWIGQVYVGAGRNFADGPNVYPRLGITIGKRF